MAALPAELVDDIMWSMSRLPVKRLLRFKLVCRNWRNLIEIRSFIDRHYRDDNNQDRLVLNEGDYVEDRFVEVNLRLWLPYFKEALLHRVGPTMGLFLEVNSSGDMVLLNPATRKVKWVPQLPLVDRLLVSDLTFGFGLDPQSGDHKIVAFSGKSGFLCVYNSSSDCWKRIAVEIVGSSSFSSVIEKVGRSPNSLKNEAFLNGFYYWMVLEGLHNVGILAFDMTTETFREIQVPRIFQPRISMYGDSIGLLGVIELWVMDEHGCWSRMWKSSGPSCDFPLLLWKKEVLFIDIGTPCVVLLHVPSLKYRSLEAQPLFHSIPYGGPFSYKESLISIKGEQGDDSHAY